MPLWYWVTLVVLAAVLGVMKFIEDNYLRYDIHIDDDFIKGCRCVFHPFTGHIEVINPETDRVIYVKYHHYSIENKYFKRTGRNKNDEDGTDQNGD